MRILSSNFTQMHGQRKPMIWEIFMYLNRLSGEKKILFLDLCIHASKADGIFAEEEKQYIQQYCVKKFDECIWRSQPFIV